MSQFIKVFIAASILLNLLLAGMIIGHFGRYAMAAPREGHRTVKEMAAMLPAEQRGHFQEIMQRTEKNAGELREQLNDARKKAANILKAEPFDKQAYMAQMKIIQQLRGQIMQRMVASIAQLAGESTPEERAALADMLYHPRPPSDE